MFEIEASFCVVEGPGSVVATVPRPLTVEGPGSIEVTVFRLFAGEGSESMQSPTCFFFRFAAFVGSRLTGAFCLRVAFVATSLPDVLLGSKNPMPTSFV